LLHGYKVARYQVNAQTNNKLGSLNYTKRFVKDIFLRNRIKDETAKLYVKHPGHRRWRRGAGGGQAPPNF